MAKPINRTLGGPGYVLLYGVPGSGETLYKSHSNLLRSCEGIGGGRKERQPCEESLEERHGDV